MNEQQWVTLTGEGTSVELMAQRGVAVQLVLDDDGTVTATGEAVGYSDWLTIATGSREYVMAAAGDFVDAELRRRQAVRDDWLDEANRERRRRG